MEIEARFASVVAEFLAGKEPLGNRSNAQEKMQRLSKQQFADLATDVLDEVCRRNTNSDPFLPVSPNFAPKRNQARQKLATLPLVKFIELAHDVYTDYQKRYLQIPPQSSPMSPNNSNFSYSNSGIPHESVESMRLEFESRIQLLQSKLTQIQTDHLVEINDLNSSHADSITALKSSHHEEISSLKTLLENEKTKARDSSTSFEKLLKSFEALQEDYNSQQQIAQDIRLEATNLLAEIKNLTRRNQELQALLADSKSQPSQNTKQSVLDPSRIQEYTEATDVLVQAAHSSTPTNVLFAMKAIVIACKNITEDAEAFEEGKELTPSAVKLLEITKLNLSTYLTGLMHAAKSFAATSGGNSTVSTDEVESNLSRLSTCVYDLINILNGLTRNDLKSYLESQTDEIVTTIQTLLQAMRAPPTNATPNPITDIISRINDTVTLIVLHSRACVGEMKEVDECVDKLELAAEKIVEMGGLVETGGKGVKQKVAACSYEIAKYVKELIGCLGE